MAAGKAHHAADRGARRRGRRRAGVLAASRRDRRRALRAGHLDPGRRPAHRRHHLLPRDRARCRRAPRAAGRAPRAGAQRRARRGRPGGGQRAAGGDAGHRCRLRHARPHDARRLIGARVHRSTRRRPWATAGSTSSACWIWPGASRAVPSSPISLPSLREAKAPLNAVLLGAIAASGVLPIAGEIFRAAIRAEGKAVDANLRGFEAGISGEGGQTPRASTTGPIGDETR